MSSRKQRIAAIILGGVAIVSICAVAMRFASGGGKQAFILEKTAPAVTEQEKLNINTATQEELEALPGIGAVLAGRIIARREESGSFADKDDLLAVSGVGEAVYEIIAPYITF